MVTATASPRQRRRYKGLSPRVIVGGLAGAITLGIPAMLMTNYGGASAQDATIPQFPNNLVVFPNRDFVSIEGYSEYGNQVALVEVTRPGVGVVGSAEGTVTGTDVAFEVNHPGGYCWGEGTGVNVTPDIKPGDIVSIKIPGINGLPDVYDATTVLDVHASDAVQVPNTDTMYVDMHIGAGVAADQVEQRIVEPALRETGVGKRDVRAAVGAPEASNNGSYVSNIVPLPGGGELNYRAVYDFTATPAATPIAANPGLGERAMAWQVTDADANRQGLTIAEFGEPGGPGMGGCPNGPQQSGPPAPTSAVGAIVGGDIEVHWTKVTAIPGTPEIRGYRVRAYEKSSTGGVIHEISQKIMDANITAATLHGFNPTEYNVEITSISDVGETFPPAQVPVPSMDNDPPVVTASPNGGSFPVAQQVTLSTELGAEILYTIDEAFVIDGGQVENGTLYTGPINISATSRLRAVAVDLAGNISSVLQADFTITNDPLPSAPVIVGSAVDKFRASITWNAADPGGPAFEIVGYQVTAFRDAAGTNQVGDPVEVGADVFTAWVDGLPGDLPVWLEVRAKNDVTDALWGPRSLSGPLTPLGDVVANAGPDQPAVVRNSLVTLSGLGSTQTNVSYLWEQVSGPDGNTATPGANGVTVLTPNAIEASFVFPYLNNGAPTGPLYFRLTVTRVGVPAVFDVVKISAANDTIAVTVAKWKLRDFRVGGTGSRPGALITIRDINGVVLGNATVDNLGAWTFRSRTSTTQPPGLQVKVESNLGGSVTATVALG